jgi:hypothetical protein
LFRRAGRLVDNGLQAFDRRERFLVGEFADEETGQRGAVGRV